MDMYKLKWTILEGKIFSLLCSRVGEKLSQREIAIYLKVSPTAVANAVKGLGDFVIIEKTKTINFVFLNRANYLAIRLKRTENLKQVYLSGLYDYLREELAGGTILLFGSFSWGEDSINSDIDIAIIERKNKMLDTKVYEKILNRKINIQFYHSWKEIHSNLRNNILNGIVLHGSVEL